MSPLSIVSPAGRLSAGSWSIRRRRLAGRSGQDRPVGRLRGEDGHEDDDERREQIKGGESLDDRLDDPAAYRRGECEKSRNRAGGPPAHSPARYQRSSSLYPFGSPPGGRFRADPRPCLRTCLSPRPVPKYQTEAERRTDPECRSVSARGETSTGVSVPLATPGFVEP